MNEAILARVHAWRDAYLSKIAPEVEWESLPVFARNGHGTGERGQPYMATLHTPPTWLHDALTGLHLNPLLDARDTAEESPGFWVMLHGYDPEALGLSAYVVPCGIAQWQIVKGAKGRLVGAKITHMMTPADYSAYASDEDAQMTAQMTIAATEAPAAPEQENGTAGV